MDYFRLDISMQTQKRSKLLPVLFLYFVVTSSVSHATDVDVYGLLDKADRLFRGKSSYMELEMIIKTENWERSLTIQSWSEGLDKTFITILSPKKDRGISTLKLKNEMWNYFPKINKVIKVPPSMMMGSWMGSDFTNDDLVKETTYKEDYNAQLLSGDRNSPYVIELKPKKTTVSVWGKIVIQLNSQSLLLEKQQYYDEKNQLVREMVLSDVKIMGGKKIPTRLVMKPIKAKDKDKSTMIIYKKAQFDQVLDKNIFTRQNLQKRR